MKHTPLLSQLSLLLILCLSSSVAWSQPLSQWLEAADDAYEQEDFYSAYRYYEVAVQYDTSRMDTWYRLGECAEEFTAYRTAENAYRRIVSSSQRDSFPLLQYHLASVLQKQGRYGAASQMYREFIEDLPENVEEEIVESAERNLINSEWAIDLLARASDEPVRHIEGDVNSPTNDFAPYYRGDTLYFSSLRHLIKKDSVMPRRSLAKIATYQEGEKKSELLPDAVNQEGRLVAHTSFSADGRTVYYTICDYEAGSVDFRCDIYSTPVATDGTWGYPRRLPINDVEATNTHPSYGADADGREFLYFSSDRPGGVGGMDLYRSELLEDAGFGPVEPLTDLNTDGDDVTPFFYSPTQVLYFSTNGRLTMGGYDIYRAGWNGRRFDRPANMGVPVNTSYDDLYYSRFENRDQAYLASNRPDTLAIFWDESKDACCNDIYSIGVTDDVRLLATTFNALDSSELEGCTVGLYEIGPAGSRLIAELENPTANDFKFTVVPGKQYELVASKSRFSTARDTVDLTEFDPSRDGNEIERQLYLSPAIELDVFTFNQLDSTELAGTTAMLYELAPDGELILVDSIVNPSANDHHFLLDRGKKYQVVATKPGFLPADTVIDTNDPDIKDAERIERDLYLEPGLILEVYTWRLLDEKPLAGSTVYLYEYTDQDGEVLVDSLTNPVGNQFAFIVEKGKRYVITGEKDGFAPALTSLDLSGDDVPDSGTYRKDLYLGQRLLVYVFDSETKEPLPGAEVRLINPETELLLFEKINPDSNNFEFAVTIDREYQLEVDRKGYRSANALLEFTQQDLVDGGGVLIFDVYLDPLDDPESMLPLFLYFDNDQPNPRTTRTTTNEEYVSMNVQYFKQKQNFIGNFTEGMELEEAFRTRRRFNDFFNLEVRGGRYDLEEFAKRLLTFLGNGYEYEIDLQGFASPRASASYNRNLSLRRIDAVKNFFEGYEDGALMPYIRSGALSWIDTPEGETKADPRVADDLNDPKNSVFNVFASLERRVEVRINDVKKPN